MDSGFGGSQPMDVEDNSQEMKEINSTLQKVNDVNNLLINYVIQSFFSFVLGIIFCETRIPVIFLQK